MRQTNKQINIGLIIRTLREERNMTQVELARKAGINQSYLSRVETTPRGNRIPPAILEKIAAALGVTYEEIAIRAGIRQTPTPIRDLQWKELERLFFSLPPERREELIAYAQLLKTFSRKLSPRLVGNAESEEKYRKDETNEQ